MERQAEGTSKHCWPIGPDVNDMCTSDEVRHTWYHMQVINTLYINDGLGWLVFKFDN